MADAESRTSAGSQTQPLPTRLQRRAPASIQISRPSNWNVAIPLLSPLVSPSSDQIDPLMADNKSREESRSREQRHRHRMEVEQAPTFTKWQHPAAPFYYGPVARATPFVPV